MIRREWRHFSGEIYNYLPDEIKEISKIGLFKVRVKNWLFEMDEELFDRLGS